MFRLRKYYLKLNKNILYNMSKNCVLKGTLIQLENDETKEIELLKVGEKLLSYSIEGIENTQKRHLLGKTKVNEFEGEFSYQLIKNIWENTFEIYYKINNELFITEDHYVLCKRNDEYYWIQVESLKIGDLLFKLDNTFKIIESLQRIEEEKTVYNLQVNSIYTFFANGYLVHNGSANCPNEDDCEACYDA